MAEKSVGDKETWMWFSQQWLKLAEHPRGKRQTARASTTLADLSPLTEGVPSQFDGVLGRPQRRRRGQSGARNGSSKAKTPACDALRVVLQRSRAIKGRSRSLRTGGSGTQPGPCCLSVKKGRGTIAHPIWDTCDAAHTLRSSLARRPSPRFLQARPKPFRDRRHIAGPDKNAAAGPLPSSGAKGIGFSAHDLPMENDYWRTRRSRSRTRTRTRTIGVKQSVGNVLICGPETNRA